ncbi:unnamed protein product [Blepharisma stoltei]|uniref:Phosphodiesterase n=1 Tax=Blepharisma stoltei TaxID=1481888 RepID=A0AAU9IQA1_9CILI|nr:unnamed protein product [Blepharisma stoltei]
MRTRQSNNPEENPFTLSGFSAHSNTHFLSPLGKILKFPSRSLERHYQNVITSNDSSATNIITELRYRLKIFLFSYYFLLAVYLLIYIIAVSLKESTSRVFGCQIGLFLGQFLANSSIYLLGFYTMALNSIRPELLQISYFLTAVMLILNNGPVQAAMFDEDSVTYMSCLPGLLVLLSTSKFILHTNFLNYFLWNTLIAVVFLISHILGNQHLATTLFEVGFFYYRVLVETKTFYTHEVVTRKKFQMTVNATEGFDDAANHGSFEPKTELEEIIDCLLETLTNAKQIIADISADDNKSRVMRIHELVNKVVGKIRSQTNIYSTDIETITKGLDEDDKLFIKQTQNEQVKTLPIKPRNKLRVRKTDEIALTYKVYDVEELIGVLKHIGKNWNFDMFFLKECTRGKPLVTVGKYSMKKFRLDEILNINEMVYVNFFQDMEQGYKTENPYHNSTHAADVLSSFLFFINQSVLSELFSEYDMLAVILAALGHDVGHPGLTNRFLIVNKDDLANMYNDYSVLEMMHCSTTFQLLKGQDANILASLDTEHYTSVRKLIIEMILATDMSKHWDLLAQFKAKALKPPNQFETVDQRIDILKMSIKAADVGHAAKSIDLHHKWSKLVIEEFFRQGDMEKSMKQPVSMYCDRETTDISKSQAGFIRMIVLPLYEALSNYLGSAQVEENCLEQLKANLASWEYEMNRNKIKTLSYNTDNSSKNSIIQKEDEIRRCGTQRIIDLTKKKIWPG